MKIVKNVTGILLLAMLPSVSASGQDSYWQTRSPMPTKRFGFCTAVFDGKIFVMGGQDSLGKVIDVVERYDPVLDRWEVGIAPLKSARVNAAAAVYDGKIFVMGGRSKEGEILKKVESYLPSENKWEEQTELHEERQGHGAIVLLDRLYVVGGSDEDDHLTDDSEYFDPTEGRWRHAEDWSLDIPRASFSLVSFQDSAFVIGGFNNALGPLNRVQRFHPVAGSAERNPILTPRGSLAAAVAGDTVYVMGGRDQNDTMLSSVEIFLPAQNVSFEATSLEIPRENFAAVAVDRRVFVIGGSGTNGKVLNAVDELIPFPATAVHSPEPPGSFHLAQNFPNPFNSGTKIEFEVSTTNSRQPVTLTIFNVGGQRIKTLVDEAMPAGVHRVEWEGTDERGKPVGSGVYFYVLQQGRRREARKMTYIR